MEPYDGDRGKQSGCDKIFGKAFPRPPRHSVDAYGAVGCFEYVSGHPVENER